MFFYLSLLKRNRFYNKKPQQGLTSEALFLEIIQKIILLNINRLILEVLKPQLYYFLYLFS